jgi:hypothetical protein
LKRNGADEISYSIGEGEIHRKNWLGLPIHQGADKTAYKKTE